MKQSSIDWLVDQLPIRMQNYLMEEIEKARQIHKEEIEEAQSYAISNADMSNNKGYFDCEKYYNETYERKTT